MPPKSVLITGCSTGGIGHALALSFSHRGLTVFATARSPSKMSDLASLPNMHILALDVTDPASIAAAAKEVELKTGGKLDVLVNNAGQQYVMPTLDVDVEKAKELFDVNYWAAIRMVQHFGPLMIAARGVVVNVGSTAGVLNVPFQSQYNASKAALNILSETLRLELAPFYVRVITLMAGGVKSNIATNTPPPASLPRTSVYLPVEEYIAVEPKWDEMDTDKFAEKVVDAVVKGRVEGKMWAGTNVGIIRMLQVAPQWIFDKVMLSVGRGLDKMPYLA